MNKIQEIFSFDRLPRKLSLDQQNAVKHIRKCRTGEMGGFVSFCEDCGNYDFHYRSCGNRNCPQCQGLRQQQWVAAREKETLNVSYYHVIFTVPNLLNPIILQKPREMYNILFQAASETLLTLCADPKWLGAKPGLVAVLHSWGSTLSFHPHLHVILSSCGLSSAMKATFPRKETFFIPIHVLSSMFRGKFLSAMKKTGISPDSSLYEKKWVVHLKDTSDYGENVIRYLGRYTHRTAISESRIVSYSEEKVTFRYKDYRDGCTVKEMTLDTEEFIRRYLMHVLPKGFRKIRFYGYLSNRCKKTALSILRNELHMPGRKNILEGLSAAQVLCVLYNKDVSVCPKCGSKRLIQYPIHIPHRRE